MLILGSPLDSSRFGSLKPTCGQRLDTARLPAGIDLDEEEPVVRVLVGLVVVAVRLLGVRCGNDPECLGRVVGKDQRHLYYVLVRDGRGVRDSKRLSSDWLARSPHLGTFSCVGSQVCAWAALDDSPVFV
jgi:hypothetical protein